jgi:hypothetical protein
LRLGDLLALAVPVIAACENGVTPEVSVPQDSGSYNYGYDSSTPYYDVGVPEVYSGPMSPFVGSWHQILASGGTTCSDGSSSTFAADPTAHYVFTQVATSVVALATPGGCPFTYRVAGSTATLDPAGQTCSEDSGNLRGTATWSTNVFMLLEGSDAGLEGGSVDDAADAQADDAGPTQATLLWNIVSTIDITDLSGNPYGSCSSNGQFGFVRD